MASRGAWSAYRVGHVALEHVGWLDHVVVHAHQDHVVELHVSPFAVSHDQLAPVVDRGGGAPVRSVDQLLVGAGAAWRKPACRAPGMAQPTLAESSP